MAKQDLSGDAEHYGRGACGAHGARGYRRVFFFFNMFNILKLLVLTDVQPTRKCNGVGITGQAGSKALVKAREWPRHPAPRPC